MKEGIGGTFMIYVFLVFLAVYITFLAVAFNYARAFRVKNKVIDIIDIFLNCEVLLITGLRNNR